MQLVCKRLVLEKHIMKIESKVRQNENINIILEAKLLVSEIAQVTQNYKKDLQHKVSNMQK